MKGKALLFGLNYAHCKSGKLNGCINDVNNIAEYIQSTLAIPMVKYTDDVDLQNTSYNGILKNLYNLAVDTWRENLDFIWIHYSGHGSHQKDQNGDEKDGYDEGLVPSDYEYRGILIDDMINHILSVVNPKTKVLFICDACHSGSILDLKYAWNASKRYTIDNSADKIRAKTILISGCMDDQTSADAYNVLGDHKSVGALSACILTALKYNPNLIYDAFALVEKVRSELKRRGFAQYPCLSSTYDLNPDPNLIIYYEQQTPGLSNLSNYYTKPQRYYEPSSSYSREIQQTQQVVQQQAPIYASQQPRIVPIVRYPQPVQNTYYASRATQPVQSVYYSQPYQYQQYFPNYTRQVLA